MSLGFYDQRVRRSEWQLLARWRVTTSGAQHHRNYDAESASCRRRNLSIVKTLASRFRSKAALKTVEVTSVEIRVEFVIGEGRNVQ